MQARQRAPLALSFFMAAVMFPALVASADSAGRLDSTAEVASSVPINSTPDSNHALSVFHIFTETWMNELRDANALRTVAASSGVRAVKRVSMTHTDEVKATNSAVNPYVGILHYTEELYECADAAETNCTIIESTPVTEIFRYQNGAWIY